MDLIAIFKRRIKPLLLAKDRPDIVASGVGVGMFVALTPTVGVQIAIVLLLAAIPGIRFNLPVALAMVWISNPFTTIPLYYGMYWIGIMLLGQQLMGFGSFKQNLRMLIESTKEGEGFFESLRIGVKGLFDIGVDIAVPMWVGGIVLGVVCSVPSALFTYRWLLKRMQRRKKSELEKSLTA